MSSPKCIFEPDDSRSGIAQEASQIEDGVARRPILTVDTGSLPQKPPAARLHGVDAQEVNGFEANPRIKGDSVHKGPIDQPLENSNVFLNDVFLMVNESVIDIVLLRAELAGFWRDEAQLITCFDQALKIASGLKATDELKSEILAVKVLYSGAKTLYASGDLDGALQGFENATILSASIPEDERITHTDEFAKWTQKIREEMESGEEKKPGIYRRQSSAHSERSLPAASTLITQSLRKGQRARTDSGSSSPPRNLDSLNMEFADITTPVSAIDRGPRASKDTGPTKPALPSRVSSLHNSYPSSRRVTLESQARPLSRPEIQRSSSSFSATYAIRSAKFVAQSRRASRQE